MAEKLDRYIYRLILIVLLIAAAICLFRFLKSDNTYSFDIGYIEHNDDSLVINCFNLRAGGFSISFEYSARTDHTARIQADNDLSFDVELPAGAGSISHDFSLAHPTDRFKVIIPADNGSDIDIKAIGITSGRFPLFTDHLLYALLCIAAVPALIYLRRKDSASMRRLLQDVLFLSVLFFLVNIPYYQKGLAFTADIRAHMQRIEGVMEGLMDRQLPVIISPNMMNEFGELSFLYPDVFLYPFGILRIIGVSMLTSYRLCMFFVNALTVILAYISFRLISRERVCVLAATAMITFEPYRLYNMLGRGSGAGNAIASAFLPLVVAGIYLILKGDGKWWVLSVGMTGVLESHVLTLLILMAALVVLGIVFIRELLTDNKYLLLLKAAGLALLMNAGFLVIFIKCYMTDWDPSALEWSDFSDAGYGLVKAFTDPWSLFQIAGIAVCIYLLIVNRGIKEPGYRFALAMILTGAILYVTTWRIFPWDTMIKASQAVERLTAMLQVPQRVLAVSSVFLICGMVLLGDRLPPQVSCQGIIISALLGICVIFGTAAAFGDYYFADYLMPDEIYGDHNSLPIRDYMPYGTTDESWKADIGYVSDEAYVESVSYLKRGTHIDYTYISHKDGAYADMPLLYYEWYKAKDENGKPLNVRKSEDGRVIVDLTGDGMQHEAHIYFDMGAGYRILWLLSLVFTVICTILILKHKSRVLVYRDEI